MSQELFTNYYKTNFWQGSESLSGPGSDRSQTRFLIKELEALLKFYEIKSILDVPCGDWNWMRDVNLSGITYIGGDIVEPLIAQNQDKFGSKTVQFRVIDICKDQLPQVDLIIVRDCFIHLPLVEIKKALDNIKASGSKFALISIHPWLYLEANQEIEVGQWRRVDLTRKPFYWAPPNRIIVEANTFGEDYDKSMGLWPIWSNNDPSTVEGREALSPYLRNHRSCNMS